MKNKTALQARFAERLRTIPPAQSARERLEDMIAEVEQKLAEEQIQSVDRRVYGRQAQ